MDTRSSVSQWSSHTFLVPDSHLFSAASPEKYKNLNTLEDDFQSCFRILGSTADTRAHASVYGFFGENCTFFPREVDLGSRGRCRVLFTPISTGHVPSIHASNYGGSYVNVDSEWKGTSRICFRIQCCAWSDGSEFCGGAVHRTLEAEAPLVPLTESFEHSFGAADGIIHVAYGRAVHGTLFWVLCRTGRVVGSWPFWSCGIKARRSRQIPLGMGRDDSVAPSRIELTRRVIIVSVGRGLVRTTCRRRCPQWALRRHCS